MILFKFKFSLIALFFVNIIYCQKLDSISNGKSLAFQNLHRVSDSVFRSEQPSKTGIKSIENLGVKSVLCLRNIKGDGFLKKKSKLIFYRKRINAWTMTENELIATLQLLEQSKKPVLVHCVHGSDRTGTVIAAYHIVFENWTKEAAIKEMLDPIYGFHANFQNLVRLLENLNVEKMKKQLNVE